MPRWRNGRRTSLRSWREQSHGGSSPLLGTIRLRTAIFQHLAIFACVDSKFLAPKAKIITVPQIMAGRGLPSCADFSEEELRALASDPQNKQLSLMKRQIDAHIEECDLCAIRYVELLNQQYGINIRSLMTVEAA